MPSPITTHILDTARGIPAAKVETSLEQWQAESNSWNLLGIGKTDEDGRIRDWAPILKQIPPGLYRLTFQTGEYFARVGIDPVFYPVVRVEFQIPEDSPRASYHIPLLLNPYGYSTYRGS